MRVVPAQDPTGAGVDAFGNVVEVADRELTQICTLGRILAQQPVRVLVRTALPRAAQKNRRPSRDARPTPDARPFPARGPTSAISALPAATTGVPCAGPKVLGRLHAELEAGERPLHSFDVRARADRDASCGVRNQTIRDGTFVHAANHQALPRRSASWPPCPRHWSLEPRAGALHKHRPSFTVLRGRSRSAIH